MPDPSDRASSIVTELLAGPGGPLEWESHGRGEPVTVFAHGLGHSIAATRPFASGVPGTRVFLQFRGHGASAAPPGPWTYDDLAAELAAVADHAGATRALGVSMGAAALCALLGRTPDRFERVVLALPAVLDRPRESALADRADRIADLIATADRDELAAVLAAEQAADASAADPIRAWAGATAGWLIAHRSERPFRELPRCTAIPDAAALSAVRAPVLVIAQEGDPTHPVKVARELAAACLDARLEVLPPGGLLWAHRDRVRRLVAQFLTSGRATT